MTDAPLSWTARNLIERGYIDATATHAKVRELVDAGISVGALSRITRIPLTTLTTLNRGQAKLVNPEYASKIAALTIEDALELTAPPTPYVDDVQLGRILKGADVKLPSYDKPGYARALYARGWQRTRISKRLAMSGTYVNRALEAA
jgi:hypothetical protein